jgi:phosphonate transport system substrate-binding protein
VLLGASSDPQARDALRQFFSTTGFYEIDAPTQQRLDDFKRDARALREALE